MEIKFPVNENRPFFGKFWPEGIPKRLDYDYNLTLRGYFRTNCREIPRLSRDMVF